MLIEYLVEPSDMSDYGSVVTYYELDDEYPRYEASTGEIGRLSILHNNFVWYDFDKKIWCSNGDIEICDNSVSATNSWYFYFNQPMGDKPLVEIGSLKYEMLFPNIDGSFDSYWLASPFVLPTASYLAYGYLCVNKEDVNYKHFLYSDGSSYSAKQGVRIVVTIEL